MSQGPDGYDTCGRGPEIEHKVKGSRFLGQAFGGVDLEAATTALGAVRKRHHAATHHVSAWRLGDPLHAVTRTDDDGEPSGTSGAPVLAAIEGAELFDVIVVVTRYFGGTKLGKGGLVRAYGEAAALALTQAPRERVWLDRTLEVRCGYPELGAIEGLLALHHEWIPSIERAFDPDPVLRVSVRRSRLETLEDLLREGTCGRARLTRDV